MDKVMLNDRQEIRVKYGEGRAICIGTGPIERRERSGALCIDCVNEDTILSTWIHNYKIYFETASGTENTEDIKHEDRPLDYMRLSDKRIYGDKKNRNT